MSKTPFDQNVAFPLYCNAIVEIRFRSEAVRKLVTSQPPQLGPSYMQEFCYLQLRKMCELIAFGCLVAHGDIQETKTAKLQKAWNAEKIITALSRLHKNFYPEPFKIVGQLGPGAIEVASVTEPFLTKNELLALYNVECPKHLHWGTIDDFVGTRRQPVNAAKTLGYFTKISNLLTHHRIHLYGTNRALQVDASLPDCKVRADLWEYHSM